MSLTGKVTSEIDKNLLRMMKYLTKARTLVIDDSVAVLTEIASTDERIFENVTTLVLNHISIQDPSTFKGAINRLPKLSSLNLGKSIDHLTLAMLTKLKLKHLQIESAHINFDDWNCVHDFYITPDKTQIMIDLVNVLNGKLKKLKFVSRKSEVESLQKIIRDNKDIQEVELVWTGFPIQLDTVKPVIDARLVTSLDLWLDFSSNLSPTLLFLDLFKSLKKLKVIAKNSKEPRNMGCFFGHQILHLDNLRKLSYTYYHSKVCHVCQMTMIRSCSRLEWLKMDLADGLSMSSVLSELRSLKRLKLRKISCKTLLESNQEPAFCQTQLEHIQLDCESDVNNKDGSIDANFMIGSVFKRAKAVKTIILKGFSIQQEKQEFQQALFNELPRLRSLEIDFCSFQRS